MGKTALLDYAAQRAEGMTVVRAIGVEYEIELQFSGLLELMRPLLEHLAEIPPQQADALKERARYGGVTAARPLHDLRGDAEPDRCGRGGQPAADPRGRRPLDRSRDRRRAALLGEAPRRGLRRDPARRAGRRRAHVQRAGARAAGPEEARPRGRRTHPGRRGQRPVAADVARRLCEATQGNPLALVELGGILSARSSSQDGEALPDPVPAGPTLERAFAWRAERLSADSRRALVVAAVALSDEVETIGAALESLGLEHDALEPGEDAGLISLTDGHVALSPPTRSFCRLPRGPAVGAPRRASRLGGGASRARRSGAARLAPCRRRDQRRRRGCDGAGAGGETRPAHARATRLPRRRWRAPPP